MSYLPVIGGAIAALAFGISDYLSVKPVRRLGQYRGTAYIMLFSTLALLPFMLYTGFATRASVPILLFAVLAEIALFFGFLFGYRAFRYGDLALTAPILSSYPALTVLLAIFVLGDLPSTPQLTAIAVTVLGIILISVKFSALKRMRGLIVAGVGSAVAASVLYSFTSLFAGAYTAIIGFVLLSFMGRSISAAGGFASSYVMKQKLNPPRGGLLLALAGAGVMDAIAVLAFTYPLYVMPSSLPVLASVAGFSGGVSVILALMFLNERPEKIQWLGIALAIAGAVAISYLS